MLRPRLGDVVLVIAAASVAGAAVLHDRAGWPEWLFGTVVLACLGQVVRLALRSWRSAAGEARHAKELARTVPYLVALDAVREERRRLSDDIVVCLRDTLGAVRLEAHAVRTAVDPVPALRRIQGHAQQATSELRRQLGLLRQPDSLPGGTPQATGSTSWPRRRDLVIGGSALVLATVEAVVYPRVERLDLPWLSILLTMLAAGTVVGRTTQRRLAAVACGVLFLTGLVFGAPIVGGFWYLFVLGSLLWAIAAATRISAGDLAAGIFLVTAVTVSTWIGDPGNAAVSLAIMVVAAVAGVVVGVARRRAGVARGRAVERESELRSATRSAVTAERAVFARDLHDVVSHAVGLVAVQAAAAEMSWPHDPAAVRRSLDIIESTASTTLAELGQLPPSGQPISHTVSDLLALLDRIRAAGTPVHLTVDPQLAAEPSTPLSPVVYRIVQESLTNVVRHAPGAAAQVVITGDTDLTTVRVVDDGRDVRWQATQRGYGLVGLAERVSFVGGALEVGPDPEGLGFRVEATVPRTVGVSA